MFAFNKNIYKSASVFLMNLVFALLVFSCSKQQVMQPRCILPSGVDFEEALSHSKTDLKHLECEPRFDHYFEGLIHVAKRDPDIQNKRKFSDFLQWANTEGIIDKIQARDYYNRYFNTTFMSLPDDFNVCSSCSEKGQNELELQLEAEMEQKEIGLLRACQDKDAYYAAADQYNTIMLLLDATCSACRQ